MSSGSKLEWMSSSGQVLLSIIQRGEGERSGPDVEVQHALHVEFPSRVLWTFQLNIPAKL
jgi:hypothetical protein